MVLSGDKYNRLCLGNTVKSRGAVYLVRNQPVRAALGCINRVMVGSDSFTDLVLCLIGFALINPVHLL